MMHAKRKSEIVHFHSIKNMSLSLKEHYVITAHPERSIRPLLFFNLALFLSFICNLSSFITLFMFSSLNGEPPQSFYLQLRQHCSFARFIYFIV